MPLKTGKKPATYSSRDLKFSDIPASALTTTLPHIPNPGGGYGTDLPYWGMAGNGPVDSNDNSLPPSWSAAAQGAGDCTCAGPDHETMESAFNARRPAPVFNAKTAIGTYIVITGIEGAAYDPVSGANDNGCDVRDVLNYRQKTGIADANGNLYKIGAYVSVEPGNLLALWQALYLFEAVGIGINFPNSAMDQTNAGQMWSVVPGATIEGGHYIPLVGHPTNNVWTCITWGKRQTMTPQFISQYCDEAWAYLDAERYNAVTGETLQNFRDADLERYLSLV